LLTEFQVKRYESAHAQITQYLRGEIISGKWIPGSQLPPIKAMAQQFGTNYRTVHIALTPLVKEGLIVRVHGSGTYVRERPSQLVCAGIYHSINLWNNNASRFSQSVSNAVQQLLAKEAIDTAIMIDSRPEEKQTVPLPALVQAIERREIQCLIVGMVFPISARAIERLPIPTSFSSDATTLPSFVTHDHKRMIHLALGELKRLRCRTVGFVSHLHTNPVEQDRTFHHRNVAFYDAFRESAAALGMETRKEWIVAPEAYAGVSEQLGYDEFKKLWALPERPEGLFVFPDILARGVTVGIVEAGVRVPEELKLVFHRNAGVEFLSPLPVSWVEASADEFAEALVAQIHRQLRGEKVEPIFLPHLLYPQGAEPTVLQLSGVPI
jgi:DNA-binding LacI/PurR family transcriptional regulator